MNDAPRPAGEVVELTAADTHPLRLAVLRHDTPTREVSFAEDDWPGVRHLGWRVEGQLVAVSTWVPRPPPAGVVELSEGSPTVQLRGMATARSVQGRGYGGVLLEAGCACMGAAGVGLVWANARDSALAFYCDHGFTVVGAGFVDANTRLPHHVIVRRL